MKMYIPEIGDNIRLKEDWTFTLYAEDRNVSLAELFGYRKYGRNHWLERSKIEDEPEINYQINYPEFNSYMPYEKRAKENKKAEDESESYQAYLKVYNEWTERAKKIAIENFEVTLPKGTVLAIDRIYIRKGSSDYSSITFWAKGLGEVNIENRWDPNRVKNWKSQRFWAKLTDCNKIEFDVLEDKEVEIMFKNVKSKKINKK